MVFRQIFLLRSAFTFGIFWQRNKRTECRLTSWELLMHSPQSTFTMFIPCQLWKKLKYTWPSVCTMSETNNRVPRSHYFSSLSFGFLIKDSCIHITKNIPLHWRHNDHDGVSNHQPHNCLLNRYSGTDQRKHQSSASLAFVRGIHRRPVNSPHKWPVTRKMFPFDDVIMPWFVFFLNLVKQYLYMRMCVPEASVKSTRYCRM